MENKLYKLGETYKEVQVPKELDDVIKRQLERGRTEMNKRNKNRKRWNAVIGIAAAVLVMFTVMVNSSQVLAQSIYEIPVIGGIGELLTFRTYVVEEESSNMDITIPNYVNSEQEDNEVLVNDIIEAKVNEWIEEQKVLDEEYKEAYLETGGTEEDFNVVETTIDYKTYYNSEKWLSFEVYKYQTLAPAYNENRYFTFDLENNKEVTLSEVLGDTTFEEVKETVWKEMKENLDMPYDFDYFGTIEIDDSRSFYIDENGKIVIVFYKYEILPGSYGPQFFVIGEM
jgi:hypothetical protein